MKKLVIATLILLSSACAMKLAVETEEGTLTLETELPSCTLAIKGETNVNHIGDAKCIDKHEESR